jgi:hypothetical protein
MTRGGRATKMTVSIERGWHFCCQSFSALWGSTVDLPTELQIAPHVWVSRGLPVIPDEQWRRRLGEIVFQRMDTAMVITVAGPTQADIFRVLGRKVDHLAYGLVLQGVPRYDESFIIRGWNGTGSAEPTEFHRTRLFFVPSRGLPGLMIHRAVLDRAVNLAASFDRIDIQGEDWRRLRRAIDALLSGTAEDRYQDERIHQFTRCLEGLILPEKGTTQRDFLHRTQTFAVAYEGARTMLCQIYEIRSRIEHLQNALNFFQPGSLREREELLYKLGRRVDKLARYAVVRVLENPTLTEIFKTDASIGAFWKRPDHERLQLWGERLDLESMV